MSLLAAHTYSLVYTIMSLLAAHNYSLVYTIMSLVWILHDKRVSFIGQANSLLCYFRRLRATVRYNVISVLWDSARRRQIPPPKNFPRRHRRIFFRRCNILYQSGMNATLWDPSVKSATGRLLGTVIKQKDCLHTARQLKLKLKLRGVSAKTTNRKHYDWEVKDNKRSAIDRELQLQVSI